MTRYASVAALFCLIATLCCAIDHPREDTDNLLTLNGAERIDRFEVQDGAGLTLWAVRSALPASLMEIRYGIVPNEFEQVVPMDNRVPRPLINKERIIIHARTRTHFFQHEGIAVGTRGFLGGVSTFTPR